VTPMQMARFYAMIGNGGKLVKPHLLLDVEQPSSNHSPGRAVPTSPPPAPANDNFANAQVISGCSGSVAGVNISAIKEPGEPSHSPDNNQGGASVWYQWQAPVTSTVTITTAGSNFDTVLAVYTGPSVSSLTVALQPDGSIAKNDDIPDVAGQPHNVTSSVTVNVTAGTIYKIAVDGYNNVGAGLGVGDINLNWTEANCTTTQPPTILTEEGATNKAAAFESVTFVRGPFTVSGLHNFSSDQHTRVILFTSNLGLSAPDPSKLTVTAGGTSLTVENVGPVSGVTGLDASYIVVRLPTGLPAGDLPLVVTLNGVASSNNPTLGISL